MLRHFAAEAQVAGMQVFGVDRPWSEGGPSVFHSEWWLRAHWDRAFDAVKVTRGDTPGVHSLIVLRRSHVSRTAADLELPEDGDSRELAAAPANLAALQAENRALRERVSQLEVEIDRPLHSRVLRKLLR